LSALGPIHLFLIKKKMDDAKTQILGHVMHTLGMSWRHA
jgi:hypothetical protein